MEFPALPFVVGVMVVVAFFLYMLSQWMVNVGPTQIAICERRYSGEKLATGRVFATGGEIGIQAEYLRPGLHFIPWPFLAVIQKVDFVEIGPNELGVVTATDGVSMPSGRIFAEDKAGEQHDNFQNPVAFLKYGGIRGTQLRFLTNGKFMIHPRLFQVQKIRKTVIPQGQVGVVTAADGQALDTGRLLGKAVVNHDSFQKAEIFLSNGGQKGPQIDFLRPGTYNILTSMFTIELKEAVQIHEDQIGIVEAKDGQPLAPEDYVATTPELKNGFQDAQMFLNQGGMRGPQESVLRPGTYYINTLLFEVQPRPATVVKQGEVAVLIANIGKDPSELFGAEAGVAGAPGHAASKDPEESRLQSGVRQRHVVPKGYRGIQKDVLGPGKYNLNPLVYTVIIVNTTTSTVEWSADKATKDFDPFAVVSNDGFEMQVEVRCNYRILPENAPFVVQKLGSTEQLEKNVIHPQIDGIFRAQVAKSPAIAYMQQRQQEQDEALEAVKREFLDYKVEVVAVLICNIHLPVELMNTQKAKNLAEQQRSMFDAQKSAEEQRIAYEQTRARADQQKSIMEAEVGIQIAKNQAVQAEERARGDAARIRLTAQADADKVKLIGDAEASVIASKGESQAEAYQKQVAALTPQGVTAIEVAKLIAAAGLPITPHILVNGAQSGDGNSGLLNLLLANQIQSTLLPPTKAAPGMGDKK